MIPQPELDQKAQEDHYHDWLANRPPYKGIPPQSAHKVGWEGGRAYERGQGFDEITILAFESLAAKWMLDAYGDWAADPLAPDADALLVRRSAEANAVLKAVAQLRAS